jgi:hypothetical protein
MFKYWRVDGNALWEELKMGNFSNDAKDFIL